MNQNENSKTTTLHLSTKSKTKPMTQLREKIAELQKEAVLILQQIDGITSIKFDLSASLAEMQEYSIPIFNENAGWYFDFVYTNECTIYIRSIEIFKSESIITTENAH